MKLIKSLCLIILACVCMPALSQFSQINQNLSKELEICLKNNWGIDNYTSTFILKQFKPLLDNPSHHGIIKEFINC